MTKKEKFCTWEINAFQESRYNARWNTDYTVFRWKKKKKNFRREEKLYTVSLINREWHEGTRWHLSMALPGTSTSEWITQREKWRGTAKRRGEGKGASASFTVAEVWPVMLCKNAKNIIEWVTGTWPIRPYSLLDNLRHTKQLFIKVVESSTLSSKICPLSLP